MQVDGVGDGQVRRTEDVRLQDAAARLPLEDAEKRGVAVGDAARAVDVDDVRGEGEGVVEGVEPDAHGDAVFGTGPLGRAALLEPPDEGLVPGLARQGRAVDEESRRAAIAEFVRDKENVHGWRPFVWHTVKALIVDSRSSPKASDR